MSARINANSCKNALGAVFLLATAFFVCSTFISMRSVFADPVAPVNPVNNGAQSGRQSPRSTSRTSNRTISRSTVSRAKTGATVTPVRSTVSRARTGATVTPTRSAVSRANASRTVSSRAVTPSRPNTNVISRGTATRGQSTRATTNNRAVRARAGTSARVSASGNIMSGNIRATTSAQNTMLTSRLNTGNYSNIIDSTTGLISADAYSNCMDAYYTCMDEICTARNAARGRCSCAGRAEKFLDAEEALRRANEELITLSGQLSLLISTKGKGKDLVAAFTLTDAEKVMNCVSWSDAVSVAGSTKDASGKPMSHDAYLKNWCQEHLVYDYEQETCKDSIVITRGSEKGPSYCYEGGNNFGFQLSDLKAGSSSDILAQLKSWAEAKDLAKQYVNSDTGEVVTAVVTINSMLNDLKYGNNQEGTSLDNLANKWGYKLFEYAHNNVCNRVLDSCFNGIFEACGTPISVTDSDEITHSKCQNGAATSCPFNFNSYISVDSEGDVELHERSTTTTTAFSSASCFGYTSASYSGYSGTLATKKSLTSTDPYANLRGPVADARRSIMQKYLLDSNAACDVYGDALTNTAQNINYQKVAAEQALQQKRLEFKQQEDSTTYSNYVTYAENFSTCMDEIWDCYYNFDETWTTARVKTYCAQKSNVPHCYEPMVCAPGDSDFAIEAVIDEFDSGDDNCTFSQDFRSNTCRNLTTISEILHGTGGKAEKVNSTSHTSKDLREKCLVERGAQQIRDWVKNDIHWCDSGQLLVTDENAIKGYNTNSLLTVCQYITECKTGYKPSDNKKSCVAVFTGVVDADTGTGTGDSGGSGGGAPDVSGDAEPGETPVTCTIDGVNKTGTACDVCNGTDYSTTACNTVNGYDQDSVCVINDTTKYKCKAHDCGPGYVASCGAGYEIDTTQPVCKSAGFDKYKCKESTSESEPLVTCTIDGISKTGTECDVCNTADYTVDDCSAGYEIEHTCVIGGVSKHKCKVHNCGTTYKLNVAECGVGYQLSNTDTCQSGPDIKKKCVCAENSAFSDVVISNPQKNGKIRGYINDLCRCNNGYSVWNNTCKSSCTSDQYRDSTTGECVSGCPNLINAYTSDTNMENQGCCGYALIKQGGGTWVQYTSDINNIFSSNGLNTTNLKGASTSKYIGIALTVDSEGVCKCPSGLYEFPDGNFRLSDNTVVTPDSDASGVYNNTVNEFVNKDVYCDLVITE